MLIYMCPTEQKYACSWEGKSEDILHHFEEEHDELLHFSDTFIIDLSTLSENRLLFVEGEIYLAQTRICKNLLDIKLRYLGPIATSKKIVYTVLLKANYDLCHPEYISVTKNGSIAVDLAAMKTYIGTITCLECTFNINKDLDEEEEDEVFFNKSIANKDIFQQFEFENVDSTEERYNVTSLALLPIGIKKEICSKNPDILLSRSKTISGNVINKKQIQRAKSTVSLGAISENNTNSTIYCTKCLGSLIPPIFLFPCGHNICQNCQSEWCHICSGKEYFQRNNSLEENFESFLLPCKYKKYGCSQKLLSNDLSKHEINCKFCEYQCPIDNCYVQKPFKNMLKHIKIIHGAKIILESFMVIFQNIPEIFLVNEELGIFYCYVKFLGDFVQWEVKFCGPKEKLFFCELKFKEGKLKQPLLLTRTDNLYSITLSLHDMKKMKVKAKNAILVITS